MHNVVRSAVVLGLYCIAAGAVDASHLSVVRTFADNVLAHGRDTYGPTHTPLFVDGIDVATHEPVVWRAKRQRWIISNLASQQDLFRTLDALTKLTGDPTYRAAATAAIRHAFANLRSPNGLLHWGGHTFYDAGTERVVGEGYKHELKCHYPYYELMWEIDPAATRRYLEAFWAGHILDWSVLDMNRHGDFKREVGALWGHEYKGGDVFFIGKGLTFVNTGSDLIYAAGLLHKLSGETGPLTWARRLAHRYVETRNPDTGLGGYQYSQITNDRAKRQFGPEFGDRIIEGTILDAGRAGTKMGITTACMLQLGEVLGDAGRDFLTWAHGDLAAYARHAYNPADNTFAIMITDGTRLTPDDVKRKGYYGKGSFVPFRAGGRFLLTYARAYRLTRDAAMWSVVRGMAKGNGLGDFGEGPGGAARVDLQTTSSDPVSLLAVLELCQATHRPDLLSLAGVIGDNIVKDRFHHGFFVVGEKSRFAKFDRLEPLALLHLEANRRGCVESMPKYYAGRSYFHCGHEGRGRTYDGFIYALQRD